MTRTVTKARESAALFAYILVDLAVRVALSLCRVGVTIPWILVRRRRGILDIIIAFFGRCVNWFNEQDDTKTFSIL